MPFSAVYSAKFIKPLLAQTVAIIQRDQAAAIAGVNTDLKEIAEFHLGRGARTAMPWLAISGNGPDFIADDDLNYREGHAVVTLALDVGDFDEESAQLSAMDYALVLDRIITSAGPWPSVADWTTSMAIVHEMFPSGMTSPNAEGTVKDVRVVGHYYTKADADGWDKPVMRVTIPFAVHLIEE